MSLLNAKELKQAAKRSLSTAAYPPKKLALIYGGICAAALLVVFLLGLYLSQQIDANGGLSGMGLRAILTTTQSALSMGISAAMPFWSLGFVFACLQFARSENVGIPTLTEGFRRFGPLLRLIVLQSAIFLAVAILAANISSMVFMMTPYAIPLLETMASLPQTELAVEDMMAVVSTATPLYVIMAVVCGALLIPVFYRFRLAHFYLLDGKHRRALVALGVSNRLMSGNRFALFKVDLSFWWYYAASGLLAVVANLDMIFDLQGWVSSAIYLIYLLGYVVLIWLANAYMQTTYAHAYDTLKAADDGSKLPVRNFPWGFLPDSE